MSNDPKEWWEGDDFSYTDDWGGTVYEPAKIAAESRSRFKEEVLRALEGMKKENSQTLLEETGERFYIYKCVEEELIDKVDIGYNKVIQQAIETIKGL